MSNQLVPAANRARTWMAKGALRGAWVHAGIAFLLGAVFGLFVRNVGIAALFGGGGLVFAAGVVVLIAAIGFGALGRMFTARPAGWLLLFTVVLWVPAVFGVAFIVFSGNGSFNQSDPTAPIAGGVAAAVVALLTHGGPPRLVGILALLAAVTAVTAGIFIVV